MHTLEVHHSTPLLRPFELFYYMQSQVINRSITGCVFNLLPHTEVAHLI